MKNSKIEDLRNQIQELAAELAGLVEEEKKQQRKIKEGDYVRFGEKVGRVESISAGDVARVDFGNGRTESLMIWALKRWERRVGDVCIFWDDDCERDAIVSIFVSDCEGGRPYMSITESIYDNCIPFINAQQYLEIGVWDLEDYGDDDE